MKNFILIAFLTSLATASMAQNTALRFFSSTNFGKDRVLIPLDAPPKAVDVGLDFTLEFKMKPNDGSFSYSPQDFTGPTDMGLYGAQILHRGFYLSLGDYGDYAVTLLLGRIAVYLSDGTSVYTVHGTTPVNDSQWYDVAVTRRHDGNGEVAIYIDGELDVLVETGITGDISYRDDREALSDLDPYLAIGADKLDALAFDESILSSYIGLIDELRISDTVRYTEAYSPVPFLVDDQFTRALYHFDEGEGVDITDSALIVGNNSAGTLIPDVDDEPGPHWVESYRPGCTDSFASNFDPLADYEDASCLYPQCGEGTVWNTSLTQCVVMVNNCPADLNQDGLVNSSDLGLFLSGFGTNCE